jgi:hypothetical protein
MRAIFLVERCGLEGDWTNGLATVRPESDDERDWVPVLAFGSRKKAQALCEQLERQARLTASPFLFTYLGELEPISEHGAQEWLARIAELVDSPPTGEKYPCKYGGIDWHAWWKAEAAELTDEQRLALWELCDLRFYRVHELPVG